MNRNVEQFIVNNYNELLGIAKKYTKNDDWAQELLQDVIVQLYNQKEYSGKTDVNSIRYYLVRILALNWCFPTSPFFRKIKKPSMDMGDLNEAMGMVYTQDELDDHQMIDLMEEEWGELDWFRKNIFERYLVMGSLKKVSKDTTIPLTSIARYVNTAKSDIRHNVFKKMK